MTRTGMMRTVWLAALALPLGVTPTVAQDGGWTHWGGDEKSQRSTPHDQISAENFEELEVA